MAAGDRTRPSDGEVLVHGPRVAKAGGQVVLPWREELRYGPRKAGYHGGAAPAEAVIPLVVLSAGVEDAVPGWAGAPVASPDWWREPLPADAPASARRRHSGGRGRPGPPQQSETLFEVTRRRRRRCARRPRATKTVPCGQRCWPASCTRRAAGPGHRYPTSGSRRCSKLLLAGNGRATMETLAARAGIPAHRIRGFVTELTRLLQVEGYPVLTVDPDGQTVKLDAVLLTEQFQL